MPSSFVSAPSASGRNPSATPSTATAEAGPSAALSVRRWFLVASLVLAGVFAILGAAADPAVGQEGPALWKAYAENPDQLQLKSFGLHWAYSFWVVPTLLIAGLIRGRGRWVANIAALLGFVALSTLPGLLFVDFYDSAIGQAVDPATTGRVIETIDGMWAPAAIAAPAIAGFLLSLPLAALAAWRAGLIRWWGPVAVVAGYAAFAGSNVAAWGAVLTTACFTVFAVELARGTRPGYKPLN